MATPLQILENYWGYQNFREPQGEIIQHILDNKDTLALLPTGGGKSVCFQVPALVKEGICLVITPLIALMLDQVSNLEKRDIKAAALFSGQSYHEMDVLLDNCVYGNYKLLYISPERIDTPLFYERLKKMNLSLIAVDEAHCISQWGYDFRPSYLEIHKIREVHPDVPIIALTASATPQVQQDIKEKLLFKGNYKVFEKSFKRDNLYFVTRKVDNKFEKLKEIIQKTKGQSIVYVRNRKKTKEIAKQLNDFGIKAVYYNAGLNGDERKRNQELWMNDEVNVVVATNAFGMGIDKPDVRAVIHLDIPDSLEAYYQEAGRAGRDGLKSYAILLYSERDLKKLSKSREARIPEYKTIKSLYYSLCNHFNLTVNSGLMMSCAFDIFEFAKKYTYDLITIHNTLKILELNGYVIPNDGVLLPSRMRFSIDKRNIYDFQLKYKEYDDLIRLLLRNYGGILHHYTVINEQFLADRLKIKREVVVKKLTKLKALDIINYVPYTNFPTITFLKNRVREDSFTLDKKALEQRADVYDKQIQAMLDYTINEITCKQTLISSYFGEKNSLDCGKCSNCLSKKNMLTPMEFEQIESKLFERLKTEGKLDMEAIYKLNFFESQNMVQVIRKLVDEKKLILKEKKWIVCGEA